MRPPAAQRSATQWVRQLVCIFKGKCPVSERQAVPGLKLIPFPYVVHYFTTNIDIRFIKVGHCTITSPSAGSVYDSTMPGSCHSFNMSTVHCSLTTGFISPVQSGVAVGNCSQCWRSNYFTCHSVFYSIFMYMLFSQEAMMTALNEVEARFRKHRLSSVDESNHTYEYNTS